MFDGLNDDDDAFFTPVPSSNLASLFGVTVTQTNAPSVNTSLTYTAPRQPSNKSDETVKNSSQNKHQSSVILFKEVHAFKLVEKNYLNQGKCGLALIGNDTVHAYQLLLYKQKNDIISSTKVSNFFQFIIQKDNYASYCDDQKQNWTVHFNSEIELKEFVSTLESRGGKIIKTNDNETNEVSRSASPKLIGKGTVFDKESPKQIDSDNQSDTSNSNVKANILSRMAKMGQKLLPNTSISDGTDSDTERDKSLHNKNRKTKRGTITTSPTSGASSSSEITKKSVNLSPSRTNTVSVQGPSYLQPVTQQYAIINGQPVPVVQSQITSLPGETNSTCHSVLPVENVSSPVMYTQVIPPAYDQLQMYFTENRTHNSEVRMNILRLTNKMEEVLEKVQKMDIGSVKVNNIENKDNTLKEENENLKFVIKKLEGDIETNKDIDRKRNKEFTEKEGVLLNENDKLKTEIQRYITNEIEYKNKIEELELKIKNFEETSVSNTEADGDKLVVKQNEKIEEAVKKIMNGLYREISDQIQDDAIQGKDVKRILAQKIVDNTYNIISAVSELSLSK